VSAGVKVTLSLAVPVAGAVADAVQEKVPATDAAPPLRVDEAKVWPKAIALAAGHDVTAGVVLEVVVVPPPLPPHPAIHKLPRTPSQIADRRPNVFIALPLPFILPRFYAGIRS
jgi:hypothetical protein